MNLITPLDELKNMKSRELAVIRCEHCSVNFLRPKHEVQKVLAGHKSVFLRFCSKKCSDEHRKLMKNTFSKCDQCGKEIIVQNNKFKKTKKHFCSHSCSALYSNKHRSFGNRRSAAEDFLISLIKESFPSVKIIPNERKFLSDGLEIDIWLPELPLAIELNGPTHYLNIFGKLSIVQDRDYRKQAELEKLKIPLIILNISSFKNKKACFNFLSKEFNENLKKVIGELCRLRSDPNPFTGDDATTTPIAP